MWKIKEMKKYVFIILLIFTLISCHNTNIKKSILADEIKVLNEKKCISKIDEYRIKKYLYITSKEIYQSVEHWSKYYDIDTSIILGLIVQESNYNIYATSCCDCRGLCQIANTTVTWFNNVNGKNYSFDEIYDYDKNIEVCCWLLRRLYDYSDVLGIEKSDILIAYNVGHNNVVKYKYKQNYNYHKNIIKYAKTFRI